jgi:hypothetical protein
MAESTCQVEKVTLTARGIDAAFFAVQIRSTAASRRIANA